MGYYWNSRPRELLRPRRAATGAAHHLAQQFRQLGDIAGNPSRLILAEQLGGGASARLILEIDIR
jgi:hypothetical protein